MGGYLWEMSLRGGDLAGLLLLRQDLRHRDFRGANLAGADFAGADLSYAVT